MIWTPPTKILCIETHEIIDLLRHLIGHLVINKSHSQTLQEAAMGALAITAAKVITNCFVTDYDKRESSFIQIFGDVGVSSTEAVRLGDLIYSHVAESIHSVIYPDYPPDIYNYFITVSGGVRVEIKVSKPQAILDSHEDYSDDDAFIPRRLR